MLTNDWLDGAQKCIQDVLLRERDAFLAGYGSIDVTIKGDMTPVTEQDKAIEARLRAALKDYDAGVGLLGEEYGKEGNEQTYWLIDPIDGTESYIRGLPYVRHLLTLIDTNEPVYTYCEMPITQELFTARKGGGAFCNDQRIQVSDRPLERSWIELSVPFDGQDVFDVVERVRKAIAGYRTIGSFPLVANGKLDGQLVYKAGGGPWDYAPRVLLVREAGGRASNIGTDDYDMHNNNILFANARIYDQLMEIITQ